MAEQESHSIGKGEGESVPRSQWPVEQIAGSLMAETELVEDYYFGTGILYHVGLSNVKLITFESHGVIKVQTGKDELSSADMEPVVIDEYGVRFYGREDGHRFVMLDKDGQVFTYTPPSSAPAPKYQYPSAEKVQAVRQSLTETPVRSSEPVPQVEAVAGSRSPASDAKSESVRRNKEKKPRTKIQGRVGTTPRFRKSKNAQKSIAEFDIAVHPDEKTTIWTTIVLFDKNADRLKEQLQRGQAPFKVKDLVEVEGYHSEREIRRQDKQGQGMTTIKPEFNGMHVRVVEPYKQ